MQVDTVAGGTGSHCWVCHVRAPAGGIRVTGNFLNGGSHRHTWEHTLLGQCLRVVAEERRNAEERLATLLGGHYFVPHSSLKKTYVVEGFQLSCGIIATLSPQFQKS